MIELNEALTVISNTTEVFDIALDGFKSFYKESSEKKIGDSSKAASSGYSSKAEAAEKEYIRLLSIPHASPLRAVTDACRAYMRDLIASLTGRTDEDVQNDFEARVFA